MNILQINASSRLEGGNSSRLANDITARLLAKNPAARLSLRELAREPHPMQDAAALDALQTPAEQRTPAQQARVALDDACIAELQAADVLVLGVPMYNFGIPAQLKQWIDAITRVGVTFRYTENGPVGLLCNKPVYVALARGGRHRGTETDTQTPYLKTILGFLGLSDVQFIYAEGLNMGPEALQQGLAEAGAQIAALPV